MNVKLARCMECNATFTLSTSTQHVCQSEHVAQTGRCEDFPCCGHRPGQCSDRAEYTSEFWQEAMDEMDADRYDRMCEALDRQEAGY